MASANLDKLAAGARWVLLILLAGHLVLRREFAHLSLGRLFGLPPENILSRAYITEVMLLLLLPAAVAQFAKLRHTTVETTLRGPGRGFHLALLLLLYGVIHAAVASFAGGSSLYLIARHSMLAGYVLVFCYAFLFFADQTKFVAQAAVFFLIVALLCAGADTLGLLTPKVANPLYPNEPCYGQQTLPIAICVFGLLLMSSGSTAWAAVALAALVFVGWRQSARPLQTVVPVSIAGAVALYLLFSIPVAIRRQSHTFKRAILLAVLFGVLCGIYVYRRKPKMEESGEINALSWQTYAVLFEMYDAAQLPDNPKLYPESPREAGVVVSELEPYRLTVTWEAAQRIGGTSVINNYWRLLLWRRALQDWWTGRPLIGAGVGTPWAYNEVFKHTPFHYEEDPSGLSPHNSYLNVLRRYGAAGFGLLLALIASVLLTAWRALSVPPDTGDVLIEGLLVAFFVSAISAFFTVALEGPSYALPFWISLGLLYAAARQRIAAYEETLPPSVAPQGR
jgi:hypothetical protein